jgi:hypothetical protein
VFPRWTVLAAPWESLLRIVKSWSWSWSW